MRPHWSVLPLLALTAACAGTPTSAPASTPSPARVATTPPSVSTPGSAPGPVVGPSSRPTRPAPWVVGASPLPLAGNGFGQVLPTPKVLRDRRLPTRDVLPPPADGRFHSTSGPITPALRTRMGQTWSPACPVALADLRYLTVTFRGFDGRAHTGELVIAARVASQVTGIFRDLFTAGFPLEQMTLPTTADLIGPPTGDGDDTAGYVCRAARGQSRFSAHAYGLAIDVNPFHNPYVKGDLVLPELAGAYTDRAWARPGMLLPGSAAVRAFTSRGWVWGGNWSSVKDYQHFSLTGN